MCSGCRTLGGGQNEQHDPFGHNYHVGDGRFNHLAFYVGHHPDVSITNDKKSAL